MSKDSKTAEPRPSYGSKGGRPPTLGRELGMSWESGYVKGFQNSRAKTKVVAPKEVVLLLRRELDLGMSWEF